MFLIGLWNYRFRPRHPPHMDTKLSWAEAVHQDELDEEFDTFPTSRSHDVVRMRYDRLRSVAGRIQTVVGDIATKGERFQSLLSWGDTRATSLCIVFSFCSAVVLYATPPRVEALVTGLYYLRHPRFCSKLPFVPSNFFKRLPARTDGAPQALLQSCLTFGAFSFIIEGLNKQQPALAHPISRRTSVHNACPPLALPLQLPLPNEMKAAFSFFSESLKKRNKGTSPASH